MDLSTGHSGGRSTGRDGRVVDQVSRLVDNLRAVKKDRPPGSARRLLLTSYNPPTPRPPRSAVPRDGTVGRGRLAGWVVVHPHAAVADAYLGLPYNVASYALLTHLLAGAGEYTGNAHGQHGNVHLYDNHVEQARTCYLVASR